MRKPVHTSRLRNLLCRFHPGISLLIILCCPLLSSAQTNFKSVEAFLRATLKGKDQLSLKARGDLNGDGLADWAGVIHRHVGEEDAAPTYQLYVLMRQPRGGFQLAEKSTEAEVPGMGCCWVEDLEIARSSIYVQNNAKTVSVMEAVTHQFKLYRGQWRLVGIRSYLTEHTPGDEGTVDTDINLLTGEVVEKVQDGDKKPVIKRRREEKSATYLLKDFDFSIRFGNEDFRGSAGRNQRAPEWLTSLFSL